MFHPKFVRLPLAAIFISVAIPFLPAHADTLLHSFNGTEGRLPTYSSLTLSGSTFYSMTVAGGTADAGTIFTMNADGTGFSMLHSFTGGDGSRPTGSLTLSGTTLYGTASFGGYDVYNGTIFSMNTNGTGFSVLHTFVGSITYPYTPDGGTPYGP